MKSDEGVLSIVLLSYYSGQKLPLLCAKIKDFLEQYSIPYEIIIVDDGSKDDSFAIAKSIAASDTAVRAIQLSRNYTSHYAAFAGLSVAQGTCAVLIPDDEQQPLDLIEKMYRIWENGAMIIFPYRSTRSDAQFPKLLAALFYYLLNLGSEVKLPAYGMDTWFIDRKVIDIINKDISKIRTTTVSEILRMGFDPVYIPYHRPDGKGKSRWTLRKKLRLASDWFFSTSSILITAMMWFGVAAFFLSVVLIGVYVYARLYGNEDFWQISKNPGWVTIVCLLLGVVGSVMLSFAIIGQYILRIYEEVKGRPSFIIRDSYP
jgi:dolichol-phosphate mannosyltransferase